MTKRTFEVGDRIKIDSCGGYKGQAEIVAVRHATGNARLGSLSVGCDVLRADGRTSFYFLHDIARWNPEAMAAGIGAAA